MANPPALTRDQLAEFLPNQELIRRFERLFKAVGVTMPSEIITLFRLAQEASIDAGIASAQASAANDDLARIARALELLASRPDFSLPRALPADYFEMALAPKYSGSPRSIAWNADDDTLNIHHLGGVTQQVGQELYGRIENSTGALIANGTALGYDPALGDFVPFIADGSLSAINIAGVATQDIPDGEPGRITVWGRVRGIDTTGTPYGEVWALGDVLYVSPTIAGGFTNAKPAAPDLCIPIAQVVVLSSTVGEIAVRPTIEQTLYYGSFIKTADQAPSAINTAQAITWDSATIANGLSIGSPTSRIVVANAGLYKFHVSIQFTSQSAAAKNIWLWFRKNGTDVANSALVVSLDGATSIRAPSRSLFLSLAAGDYVELMFSSVSLDMIVDNIPATAFAPAAPAAILTVTQEQQ